MVCPVSYVLILLFCTSQGDDAARKRIRAWLRLALCAQRPLKVAAEIEIEKEEKEVVASQARCPRWEPLKECVVFGDVEKALPTWPLNPLVGARARVHTRVFGQVTFKCNGIEGNLNV